MLLSLPREWRINIDQSINFNLEKELFLFFWFIAATVIHNVKYATLCKIIKTYTQFWYAWTLLSAIEHFLLKCTSLKWYLVWCAVVVTGSSDDRQRGAVGGWGLWWGWCAQLEPRGAEGKTTNAGGEEDWCQQGWVMPHVVFDIMCIVYQLESAHLLFGPRNWL